MAHSGSRAQTESITVKVIDATPARPRGLGFSGTLHLRATPGGAFLPTLRNLTFSRHAEPAPVPRQTESQQAPHPLAYATASAGPRAHTLRRPSSSSPRAPREQSRARLAKRAAR